MMGTQWMQPRKPLALRMHKHKKGENPHEYCYSEMQLYLPFRTESELFPDDERACIDRYMGEKDEILKIKGQVMKHLTEVQEERERAEEIHANEVGDILDPANEQENEDAITENIDQSHPELYVLDPGDITNSTESNQQVYTGCPNKSVPCYKVFVRNMNHSEILQLYTSH